MADIRVAESAGFCFGVDRAIGIVHRLLEEERQVCTLGPIIHNPQMVQQLSDRGVLICETPQDVPEGYTVVLRSHGVSPAVLEDIRARGLDFEDAACPFVSKIHKIVEHECADGKTVLIAGDKNHPEVQAIQGYCPRASYVVADEQELIRLLADEVISADDPVCVVAQTTFSVELWEKCLEVVKKVYTNSAIFDTICNATAVRQNEAAALASEADFMLVVGGRHSSNTAKLRDVCAAHCPTQLIEQAGDLDPAWLHGANIIGVTAGASTPAGIIKEVLHTMSDLLNNENLNLDSETTVPAAGEAAATENTAAPQPEEAPVPQKSFDEMTFEEALEASLQNYGTGERVRGVVIAVMPNEVQVDVGRKQAGFIPVAELSNNPDMKPEDVVKVGDELDLLIMRVNDAEGTIMLSKRRLDAIKGWDEIVAAHESEAILDGIVTNVIKGGLLVSSRGSRVFIPASQAAVSRGEPLEQLLRKEVQFRIIEVNTARRRAVGSIRSVLRDLRKGQEEEFWSTVEAGKTYTGVVKSLTSYGAFVDIGGVDGMIHISELAWTRIKHPSEVLTVGDTVEVVIKEADREKRRISLGYRKTDDNPWEILKKDYPVGTDCEVTIVGMTAFGAFANIIPGTDGLIHISQISDRRIEKPQDVLKVGQKVRVRITEIDYDKNRISLSIRKLIEEGLAESNAPADAPEETPAESGPETPVSSEPDAPAAPQENVPETSEEAPVVSEDETAGE